MSQAAPSDGDPSADINPPPTQPDQSDSCQDVPAAPAPSLDSLQPPLIPERFALPQSSEEAATEDNATADTAATAETSEVVTDQSEPPAEAQVYECDQPVSLEPEAAEEDVEVCSTSISTFITSPIIDFQGQYW